MTLVKPHGSLQSGFLPITLNVIGNASSTGLRLACDGLDGAGDVSLEYR